MHRLECLVPLFQGPNAADDWPDIQTSAGEQPDDAFPDRPMMAEASLEPDVFLDERIERKTGRLRTPADLRDPARGPDRIERGLQSRRNARCINHPFDSETVTASRPGEWIAGDHGASVIFGFGEACSVAGEPGDRDFRAGKARHRGAKDADRSW